MEPDEGMTPEEAAQLRVDAGVEKLDADLGPIWVHRVDLAALDMTSASNCVAAQLFGEYSEGVGALWPDAPRSPAHYLSGYCCKLCHGDEEQYNADQVVKAAENAANPCCDDLARAHGFLGDDEAEIYYDELQTAWTTTIERLRQGRPNQ
jgi:hypothetical protein